MDIECVNSTLAHGTQTLSKFRVSQSRWTGGSWQTIVSVLTLSFEADVESLHLRERKLRPDKAAWGNTWELGILTWQQSYII